MLSPGESAPILGIEGTAHTFGVGIVTLEGKILSNNKKEYMPEKGGGIHPREAAQHISQVASSVINDALQSAQITPTELKAIAFSRGPGLGPCLRTTATIARALATYLNIPLLGVNHAISHVEIGKLVHNLEDPLTVYVSGGNTMILAVAAGKYRVFGETLDIALGNLLDVFGREVGLAHPGGPKIEKMARKSSNYVELPYVVKGTDISYSGLLTASIRLIEQEKPEDLCYSLQETAFAMLAEVTERALAHTRKQEVLLTGGCAPNRRLQEMLEDITANHNATFRVVPPELAGDNGAMIAWTGVQVFEKKHFLPVSESQVLPKWRVDEVTI
ncbi:MAG: KEOPS complex N(6)-L-threonylcarbamoyladenine synthase Kae1 [Candidatus Hodarchaeota archaeon]